MIFYEADLITIYETETNFAQIGVINLNQMGNLPFYLIEHDRKPLPISEFDTLYSYADFEFVDLQSTNLKPKAKPMKAR